MPASRIPRTLAGCRGAALLIALLLPAGADAGGFGVYLMPTVGGDWLTLKSLEVEQGFISAPATPELGEFEGPNAEGPEQVSARRPVGRKSYYTGSGISVGVAAGLRLASLRVGAEYIWSSLAMDGYSKLYRYDPDKLRARGREFLDEGPVQLQRVLCALEYGLPFGPLEIKFRTRVGGVFLDEGPLIIGAAVDRGAGIAGDLGLGLELRILGWLGAAVHGSFGFVSFSGNYDGAFGTLGGVSGGLVLHL